MNERIRELSKQAGLNLIHDNFMTASQEKFAELIVQECAKVFVDQKYMVLNPHEPFAYERVRVLKQHDRDMVRKIRRHFGVEL